MSGARSPGPTDKVEFDRRIVRRPDDGTHSILRQRCSAEIRVQHYPGGIDDRPESRSGQILKVAASAREHLVLSWYTITITDRVPEFCKASPDCTAEGRAAEAVDEIGSTGETQHDIDPRQYRAPDATLPLR